MECDRFYRKLTILFIILFQVIAEPISLIIGGGAALSLSLFYGTYQFGKCKIYECCIDEWVRLSTPELRISMQSRLYGQHLAQQTVIASIEAHWNTKNPKKALVMSFHGWTGSGKNYLSAMIAESIFKKGMQSQYVHVFISTLHFSNPKETSRYKIMCCSIKGFKEDLQKWINGNVSLCERSMFIFDEIDKMLPTVINSIKPFIDHYEHLEGVDYRKSIFIFLSNSGGSEIAQRALNHYQNGRIREDITLREMEDVIIANAYNAEGGFKQSELISSHLVDHYVPFLPMERRHVLLCIRDYLISRNFEYDEKHIVAIADSLQYFPKASPIYSSSGCKRIAQKAELYISVENERRRKIHEEYVADVTDENEL